MQLIMLTHHSAKNYFESTVIDSKGSDFDQDAWRLINYVIADMNGILNTDPDNKLSPYLTFIYMMLNLHSSAYVKATSPDSAISAEHLNILLTAIGRIAPGITADNVLVADKMDILYGAHHMTHSEHSKFSLWFYEHVYNIAVNFISPDNVDDIYEEVIKFLEVTISNIEQNVIFLGQNLDPDDVVVLCLYPVNGALFFLID